MRQLSFTSHESLTTSYDSLISIRKVHKYCVNFA